MKILSSKICLVLVLVIGFTHSIFAQLPPGFGDTTIDDTSSPAPISGLVTLGVIIGAIIGYKKLKK